MALPIEKTILGMIPDLSTVLSDFEYLSRADTRRAGKYFLGSKSAQIKSFSPKLRDALHVTINPDLVPKIQAHCCEGKIGGLQLIPWVSEGVALLLAMDKAMIAHVWVGFIPLEVLPTVNAGE